jgi:hypothetical protein
MNTSTIIARLPQLADITENAQPDYSSSYAQRLLPLPERAEGTHFVRDSKMGALGEALDKLARRAAKLGVAVPAIETLETFTIPEVLRFPTHSGWAWARTGGVEKFHVLRASTVPVRLAGWRFVATIEHMGEAGNLLRTAPGFEGKLPLAYRSDAPTCDHCKLHRRRAETFVMHHEDGRFTRVGRNCLVDFIGDSNADAMVRDATMLTALLNALGNMEDEGGFGGGSAYAVDPEQFLGIVAVAIETIGWTSRKLARDTNCRSTADLAWDVIFAVKPSDDVKALRRTPPTEAQAQDGKDALAWALAIPQDTDSDFLYNIRLVAHLSAWDSAKIGLGAAVLMSYQKEQERLKRMEFERRMPSEYLGAVAQRFNGKKGHGPVLQARVLGVYTTEGAYGLTTILRMQVPCNDTTVHDVVWFASGDVQVVVNPDALAEESTTHAEQSAAYAAWQAARNVEYDAEGTAKDVAKAGSAKTYDAWRAACARHEAAQAEARNAVRTVKAGDLVSLTGTVKRQEVSKRTTRKETTLTRCTVALLPE